MFKNELIFDNFFTTFNLLVITVKMQNHGTFRKSRTLGATKKRKTLKEMKFFWSNDQNIFADATSVLLSS